MYSIIKFSEMEDGIKNCLLAYAEQGIRPKEVMKSLLIREAQRLGFVMSSAVNSSGQLLFNRVHLTTASNLPLPRKISKKTTA